MITFKRFLEAAVGGHGPEYKDLTVDEAIATLNTHCKDALWMLQENTPLWRGDIKIPATEKPFFMTVDTSATERRSENTTNYYTVIFDNIPSMADFPKRSRSFIGSTSKDRAGGYGYMNNKNFIMIPYDGVKIGIVNDYDMWRTRIKLFTVEDAINEHNHRWRNVFGMTGIQTVKDLVYEDFKKLSQMLQQQPDKVIEIIVECFDTSEFRVKHAMGKMTLLEYIDQQYGPQTTGFEHATTKDKDVIQKAAVYESEVWVSGKIMMISVNMWHRMRAAL